MSDSDDDDVPALSATAQAALQEFLAEQLVIQQKEDGDEIEEMPQENWQLSQFWYSEETATQLAKEVLSITGDSGSVACISCPTLYKRLCEMKSSTCKAVLLEYDDRFKVFGEDFIKYDYNHPLKLQEGIKESFDIVVADPPHLSENCLTNTAKTMKYLAKDKILLCTGSIMEDLAGELLQLKLCDFIPKHERNLANDFRCYSNYKTTYLN